MSKDQAKEIAKKFIEEQKQILKDHGDSVVSGKYKEALTGAQKTFEVIADKTHRAS